MENKIKEILDTIKTQDTTTTDYTLCIQNRVPNTFKIIIIKAVGGGYKEAELAEGDTISNVIDAGLVNCKKEVEWSSHTMVVNFLKISTN